MPEFTSHDAGTPSWVDHAAIEIGASNDFYGTLFGWEPDDQGEDMGHYTQFRKDGKTVAGNMPVMGDGQPTSWTSYVSVDSADETIERARNAGAIIFAEPIDVSDLGRMAVFADPTGAVIGVWEPKSFIGAELAGESGGFSWTELNTRDLSAAKAFYAEVFGWEPNDFDMGEMPYTEWKLGDATVAGMLPMPDMVPNEVPSYWLVCFGVDDTDACVAHANQLGATTLLAPTDIPPGRFAVLADPDGATFAVIKMNG